MKCTHPNHKINMQLDFNRNETRLDRNETVGRKLDQLKNEHFSYARDTRGERKIINT